MSPPPERLLAVAPGEPGGVGLDLMAALAASPDANRCVVFADPQALRARAALLETELPLVELDPADWPRRLADAFEGLAVVPAARCAAPVRAGLAQPEHAGYVRACLDAAARACLDGLLAGLVTGPIEKRALLDAGMDFCGHTEYLARQAGRPAVMMLASGALRVALATTHLPLAEVAGAVTRASLRTTLQVLLEGLRAFVPDPPRIRVLGLNPHAGEGGHLGTQERDVIAPVVEEFRHRGVEGPAPADTAFVDRDGIDCFLAMYHDQGLPVLKTLGFGRAVNVTLGLPYVRTSVDHGTALDRAGRGGVCADSLFAAIDSACAQIARRPAAALV